MSAPSMSMDMFWPFVICFIGIAMLVTFVISIRFRTEILARNSMRPWVRELITAEGIK
jgi:heme exporter protein C